MQEQATSLTLQGEQFTAVRTLYGSAITPIRGKERISTEILWRSRFFPGTTQQCGLVAQQWRLLEVRLRPSSFVWSCLWLLKDWGEDPWLNSAIWLEKQMSGAVPLHPQPLVRAPTGQGLSVLDLWLCRYWEGSEEGQKLGGKNYLESQTSEFTQSLQTTWHMTSKTEAHTRPGTYIPSLGKREDAMMQKNATNPVFIHTPSSREPDHTLTSTISCLPGQKHIYAFGNHSTVLLQCCSPQTWASS